MALFGPRLFGRKVREEGARAAGRRPIDADPAAREPEPSRPGAKSDREPGRLTRRGPLARMMLRVTRPVTAMRRTPELAPRARRRRRGASSSPASPPRGRSPCRSRSLAIGALVLGASQVRGHRARARPSSSRCRSRTRSASAADAAQQGFAPGILAPTEVDLVQPASPPRAAARAARGSSSTASRASLRSLGPREQPPGPARRRSSPATAGRPGCAVVFDSDPLGAPAIDRFERPRDRMPALVRAAGLGPGRAADFGGETALAGETVTRVLDDLKRDRVVALVVNLAAAGAVPARAGRPAVPRRRRASSGSPRASA